MTVRIVSDQRQFAAQRRAPRIGVENIEGRIYNTTFKIKKLLAQPKAVEVKKNGCVVCRMTVRSKIYPAEVRTRHY